MQVSVLLHTVSVAYTYAHMHGLRSTRLHGWFVRLWRCEEEAVAHIILAGVVAKPGFVLCLLLERVCTAAGLSPVALLVCWRDPLQLQSNCPPWNRHCPGGRSTSAEKSHYCQ